jgi:four helix bundle protein
MTTFTKVEDIESWQLARELNNLAFTFFGKIKSAYDFSLLNQMSRACGSIMDNIAEGFGRGGNKEFIHFLSIAKASGDEFKSQLYRALDRKYITNTDFNIAYEKTNKTCAKILALITYLKNSNFKGPKFVNTTP